MANARGNGNDDGGIHRRENNDGAGRPTGPNVERREIWRTTDGRKCREGKQKKKRLS